MVDQGIGDGGGEKELDFGRILKEEIMGFVGGEYGMDGGERGEFSVCIIGRIDLC